MELIEVAAELDAPACLDAASAFDTTSAFDTASAFRAAASERDELAADPLVAAFGAMLDALEMVPSDVSQFRSLSEAALLSINSLGAAARRLPDAAGAEAQDSKHGRPPTRARRMGQNPAAR
jgi:hypothetical protein